MKRLLSLLLCLCLLCSVTSALAYGVDTSIFSGEENFSEETDGSWEYYDYQPFYYGDATVFFILGLKGNESVNGVPFMQIYILDPKSGKVNFKATGMEIVINKKTYACRSMRLLDDGSATVSLYKLGRDMLEEMAAASSVTFTFYALGHQYRNTVSGSDYANGLKRAVRMIVEAEPWEYLTSSQQDDYRQEEKDYPIKVYKAK